MFFESDRQRREFFLGKLQEKLKDPEFRKIPGFPNGSDEDILRLSDPPYYTACPNPFLSDFVKAHGTPYQPGDEYRREPFAVDVSEGKRNQLYQAHGYHTKVPHLAIVPSILHYTKPGDLVLDGFSGSGMTGVAAQWCGTAPTSYRVDLEAKWTAEGHPLPRWGVRRAILNDLGPSATFIAAGYNLPFDIARFEREATRILAELDDELGWMYETLHTDGKTKARINFTVWSEVFSCPECAGEVNFVREALDTGSKKTRSEFPCPHCSAGLNKDRLERSFETRIDPVTGAPWKKIRLQPVLLNYSVGSKTCEKPPDDVDLRTIARAEKLAYPTDAPSRPFPIDAMYHGSRLEPKGFSRTHHLFLPRPTQALAALWRRVNAENDPSTRRMLVWFAEQAFWTMSILNRYRPTGYSQVSQYLTGVYYVPSQVSELSPWYVLHDSARRTTKLARLTKTFAAMPSVPGGAVIQTGDCGSIGIPDNCVDYVFTDPPFGENIYYADLNFLVESWHGVMTAPTQEAIVDRAKKKGTHQYQELMRRCFKEYHRVLKPGRWMTVVFSNSSNSIWRAIQEAMGAAGFVVADVRTLDKEHGSYRQVTSSAVKQDLIISAYRPTESLADRFKLGDASADGAWDFVTEHLRNVPVFVGRSNEGEVVAERTPQMLFDRMIAFHVQRGVSVPLSGPEFLQGLQQRFPERDGMHFLATQVSEYDRRRTTVGTLRQLELFVSDEASATMWVRQQLHAKPQSFQDLQPQFMQQLQSWAKHEKTIELKEILDLNFFCYHGDGPVPSQIHSYLSSNFKDLRKLGKEDTGLKAKAADRWYVPDPKKEGDLEKLRLRTLLKEFDEYRARGTRKINQLRTEAVRAGFKAAYDAGDYKTILEVAAKVPEAVLQEDEKLLMYYDVASMRVDDGLLPGISDANG